MNQKISSVDSKQAAQLKIDGLKNVVNMGSMRLAYLKDVVAKGGVEGLDVANANVQIAAMEQRLAAHKAEIAELEKSL